MIKTGLVMISLRLANSYLYYSGDVSWNLV